jgi:hypothetical protein
MAEPSADLVGRRVIEVVEYLKGLPPGGAGGAVISGSLVCVTQVDEEGCPVMLVAELATDPDRFLEAGDRLGLLAQLMMGVSDAVQRGGSRALTVRPSRHG